MPSLGITQQRPARVKVLRAIGALPMDSLPVTAEKASVFDVAAAIVIRAERRQMPLQMSPNQTSAIVTLLAQPERWKM